VALKLPLQDVSVNVSHPYCHLKLLLNWFIIDFFSLSPSSSASTFDSMFLGSNG